MMTPKNQLSVPEVMAYSRQEIEGGIIIRYLMRQPGEVEWQPVKAFRPSEQNATPREDHHGAIRTSRRQRSSAPGRRPHSGHHSHVQDHRSSGTSSPQSGRTEHDQPPR